LTNQDLHQEIFPKPFDASNAFLDKPILNCMVEIINFLNLLSFHPVVRRSHSKIYSFFVYQKNYPNPIPPKLNFNNQLLVK
jgi:hypothetical protein